MAPKVEGTWQKLMQAWSKMDEDSLVLRAKS
jgi:hypothetical protein